MLRLSANSLIHCPPAGTCGTAAFVRGGAAADPGGDLASLARRRGITHMPSAAALLASGTVPQPCTTADIENATESLPVAAGGWWDLRWCRHTNKLPEDIHEGVSRD